MRKVQMLAGISGTRASGEPWPAAGYALVVEDWEAEHLYRGQMARPWPGGDDTPAEHAPAAHKPAEHKPAEHKAEHKPAEHAAHAAHAHAADPAKAEPVHAVTAAEAPKPAAPKADWVEWAMANGASEDEANMATKAQLMEAYGERA